MEQSQLDRNHFEIGRDMAPSFALGTRQHRLVGPSRIASPSWLRSDQTQMDRSSSHEPCRYEHSHDPLKG